MIEEIKKEIHITYTVLLNIKILFYLILTYLYLLLCFDALQRIEISEPILKYLFATSLIL